MTAPPPAQTHKQTPQTVPGRLPSDLLLDARVSALSFGIARERSAHEKYGAAFSRVTQPPSDDLLNLMCSWRTDVRKRDCKLAVAGAE